VTDGEARSSVEQNNNANAFTNPIYWIEHDLTDNTPQEANFVLKLSDLLNYGIQVANGMQFLISKKLIHRDLAARNILMASHTTVKICDFGLSKNCYHYNDISYVRKDKEVLMPIKWLAVECIRDHVFTEKTDVWSWGILMWEIFNLGAAPYPGQAIDNKFCERLFNGHRLERPAYAPKPAYELMRKCWFDRPEERPDFRTISRTMDKMLEDLVYKQYLKKLNNSNLTVGYYNLSVLNNDYDLLY
jgi:serine/threonine protein kinase